MSDITIYMKDGTVHDYPHRGRAGGSYTKSIKYEGGMAIVEDEWGVKIAYPISEVASVKETPTRW